MPCSLTAAISGSRPWTFHRDRFYRESAASLRYALFSDRYSQTLIITNTAPNNATDAPGQNLGSPFAITPKPSTTAHVRNIATLKMMAEGRSYTVSTANTRKPIATTGSIARSGPSSAETDNLRKNMLIESETSPRAQRRLEAVSKLAKGDYQAGDLQEGQEHLGLTLVSDDQPAEVSEPRHGPFDGPAAAVAA